MKIFDYYPLTEDADQSTLELINNLVEGNMFLSGLGKEAKLPVNSDEFNIISKLERFEVEITGYLEDEEHAGVFPEHFNELTAMMNIHFQSENRKISKALTKLIVDGSGHYTVYIYEKVKQRLDVIGFDEVAPKHELGNEIELYDYRDIISDSAELQISGMVRSAYFGGFEQHPFYNQLYKLYNTGGIPCGWPALRPDNANSITVENAQQNMIMLHFGS